MTSQRLRCRCGTIEAAVEPSGSASRAVCYCTDCRAYARWIGADRVLDAAGGTEVVAMLPMRLRFTRGTDALACMSLSPRGLLRWYAGCCRTPLANTPRDAALPYAGLVHVCLPDGLAAFGPLRMRVQTPSALAPVAPTPRLTTLARVLRLAASMLAAKASGSARRDNPFFRDGAPLRQPTVLTPAERAALADRR